MQSGDASGTLAFIVMGSNIEPERHLPLALDRLRQALRVVAVSSAYRTLPVGREDVPAFLNAAVCVRTDREPADLKFNVLRPIEADLGRVRGADRNAPRTIDLDLALYGEREIDADEEGVVLPDPEITERAHIAFPLAEIAPDMTVPGTGRTLRQIADTLQAAPGLRRVAITGWDVSTE